MKNNNEQEDTIETTIEDNIQDELPPVEARPSSGIIVARIGQLAQALAGFCRTIYTDMSVQTDPQRVSAFLEAVAAAVVDFSGTIDPGEEGLVPFNGKKLSVYMSTRSSSIMICGILDIPIVDGESPPARVACIDTKGNFYFLRTPPSDMVDFTLVSPDDDILVLERGFSNG